MRCIRMPNDLARFTTGSHNCVSAWVPTPKILFPSINTPPPLRVSANRHLRLALFSAAQTISNAWIVLSGELRDNRGLNWTHWTKSSRSWTSVWGRTGRLLFRSNFCRQAALMQLDLDHLVHFHSFG